MSERGPRDLDTRIVIPPVMLQWLPSFETLEEFEARALAQVTAYLDVRMREIRAEATRRGIPIRVDDRTEAT